MRELASLGVRLEGVVGRLAEARLPMEAAPVPSEIPSAKKVAKDARSNADSPPSGSSSRPRSAVRVLFVDDHAPEQLETMQLSMAGLEWSAAPDGPTAIKHLEDQPFDLVLLDLIMPQHWAADGEPEGVAVLKRINESFPDLPVILYSESDELEIPVKLVQDGSAFWFLRKTSDPVEVESLIQTAVRRFRSHAKELDDLRQGIVALQRAPELPPQGETFHALVGKSPQMQQVFQALARIGPSGLDTVLLGESGTGKELAARVLHELSDRRDGPFVAVNCASIAETLAESEFFGTVRGAATDAVDREGYFEVANGGTLFLDEIGDLSMRLQPTILRVIQQREFMRVGSTKQVPVDLRIICATNRTLEEMVEAGQFRKDLFYRLNICTVKVPPLREHKSDIPLLVRHFCERQGTDFGHWSAEALAALSEWDWPGNVRELENLVTRVNGLYPDRVVRRQDLQLGTVGPTTEAEDATESDLFERATSLLAELEADPQRRVSMGALVREHGVKLIRQFVVAGIKEYRTGKRFARAVGLEYDNLRRWMSDQNLSVREINEAYGRTTGRRSPSAESTSAESTQRE